MHEEQFNEIKIPLKSVPKIRADDFIGADRTLLYGYTCNRNTWHVYLQAGEIHLLVYEDVNKRIIWHQQHEIWDSQSLVPDKRVYPESTDFQFARMLQHQHVDVQYLPFDQGRHDRVRGLLFHGLCVNGDGGLIRV
ncbi:hypothetical protein [Streptomyces sp. 5-10]|uniref:hypothetical protein n=1 Tax=Streptomyces sp. 5-10 TaxID=878925 RepID=UPI00168AD493|nr:hypothetical protein [Streptomyces sp. 5-10]MBD3004629.1 hypothetical protein [Streptomyces sp. 5-10]